MESLNLKLLEVWCSILYGRDAVRLARAVQPALAGRELQDKRGESHSLLFFPARTFAKTFWQHAFCHHFVLTFGGFFDSGGAAFAV